MSGAAGKKKDAKALALDLVAELKRTLRRSPRWDEIRAYSRNIENGAAALAPDDRVVAIAVAAELGELARRAARGSVDPSIMKGCRSIGAELRPLTARARRRAS